MVKMDPLRDVAQCNVSLVRNIQTFWRRTFWVAMSCIGAT